MARRGRGCSASWVLQALLGRGNEQSSRLVGSHSLAAVLPSGLCSLQGWQPSAKQVGAGLAWAPWEEEGLHVTPEQGLVTFPCPDRAVLKAVLLYGRACTWNHSSRNALSLEHTLLLRVPAPCSPSHHFIHSVADPKASCFLTRHTPTCLPYLPNPQPNPAEGTRSELQLPEAALVLLEPQGSYKPLQMEQEGSGPCCPLGSSTPWRAVGDCPGWSAERHSLLDAVVGGKQGRQRGMQTG